MRALIDAPIWASSPAAWTAVVTSSVPFGGPDRRSRRDGLEGAGRFSEGEPERTARGPSAAAGFAAAGRGLAVAATGFAAAGRGGARSFAAAGALLAVVVVVFGFAAVAAGFALPLAAGVPSRRRPMRAGRVLGRLPSTLWSAPALRVLPDLPLAFF